MNTATPKLTLRRSLALAGAFAALTVSTMSFAAPIRDDLPRVTVRYDDLNLATPAGVNALYGRISHAARAVCGDTFARDLSVQAAAERCQSEAIAQAVREVNNPQLAVVHAAHVSHG